MCTWQMQPDNRTQTTIKISCAHTQINQTSKMATKWERADEKTIVLIVDSRRQFEQTIFSEKQTIISESRRHFARRCFARADRLIRQKRKNIKRQQGVKNLARHYRARCSHLLVPPPCGGDPLPSRG